MQEDSEIGETFEELQSTEDLPDLPTVLRIVEIALNKLSRSKLQCAQLSEWKCRSVIVVECLIIAVLF
jgi:hypothetical protein